jgi:predicted DNA-binding antitoxin AbrB/MazE fold protein
MHTVVGMVENGTIRLEQPTTLKEGQRVLVIALISDEAFGATAPPAELLEEDARELAPRRDALARANQGELS